MLLLLSLKLSLLRLLLRLSRLLLSSQQLSLDLGQRRRDILDVGLLVPLGRGGCALLELLGELADVRGPAGEDVELLDAAGMVVVGK